MPDWKNLVRQRLAALHLADPAESDLAEELATVATVESAGAAMVYRISEQSIRHALDIGHREIAVQRLLERDSCAGGVAHSKSHMELIPKDDAIGERETFD